MFSPVRKIPFIISCIFLNTVVICSGALGHYWRFFISSVLIFIFGNYLLKVNPFSARVGSIFIFGLNFLLLTIAVIASFFYSGFKGYPIYFGTIASITAVFLSYKKPVAIIFKRSVLFILVSGIVSLLLPNYFDFISHSENSNQGTVISNLELYDENGSPFILNQQKKITVLDLWDSSCGVCIKEFPKFEALQNEFSQDSTIQFYTVNMPVEKDQKKPASVYTNDYSFGKLYAGKEVRNQLGIHLIPQYVIIDKDAKIRYIGSLNTGQLEFYNNFYSILREIRKSEN